MQKSRTGIGALLALVLVIATGCWRQDGGDAAHSGFDPAEHHVTAANVGTLTREWTTRTGNPSTSPVISGSSTFAASADGVTAYDVATGTVKWTAMTPDPNWGAYAFRNLTVGDHGLMVPYGFIAGGGLATLDQATGAQIDNVGGLHQATISSNVYRADASAQVVAAYGSGGPFVVTLQYGDKSSIIACCDFSQPRPTEPSLVGRFAVVGIGSAVAAYSLDTCAPPPTSGTGCAADWSVDLGSAVATPVGLDPSRLAVTLATGDIKVLGAGGAVQWTADVPTTGTTMPAIGKVWMYAGGADGKVYAFPKDGCGAATCAPSWSVDAGAGAISHQPAIGADVVYVGTATGKVVALASTCATASCAPRWTGTIDDATTAPVMGVAIESGRIIATSATAATASSSATGTIAAFHLP